MSRNARIFVTLVCAFAALLAVVCLPGLEISSPVRFSGFLLLSLVSSAFKVRIPGIDGMYSLNFIVMLAAVTELAWAELVLIALGCAVTQSYWRAAVRPQLIQIAFNASNLAISISGAYAIFHTSMFWPDGWLFLSGALAALGFYALNTGLTAVVLCLVEDKGLKQMWAHWNLYTLPYYLLGSTLSTAWTFCCQQVPWQGALLFALLLYLIFRVFRRSVSLEEAVQGCR